MSEDLDLAAIENHFNLDLWDRICPRPLTLRNCKFQNFRFSEVKCVIVLYWLLIIKWWTIGTEKNIFSDWWWKTKVKKYFNFWLYARVEIYKILNGMNPEYLSHLFSRSTTPYNLRDNSKLIQPIKRTTTYGVKSLAYYGTHLWNLLPLDVKGAITLNNFKTLMRKWAGPTCGCSVCDMVI